MKKLYYNDSDMNIVDRRIHYPKQEIDVVDYDTWNLHLIQKYGSLHASEMNYKDFDALKTGSNELVFSYRNVKLVNVNTALTNPKLKFTNESKFNNMIQFDDVPVISRKLLSCPTVECIHYEKQHCLKRISHKFTLTLPQQKCIYSCYSFQKKTSIEQFNNNICNCITMNLPYSIYSKYAAQDYESATYDINARKYFFHAERDEQQFKTLCIDILQNGIFEAIQFIIYNKHLIPYNSNKRILAAKLLRLPYVPCCIFANIQQSTKYAEFNKSYEYMHYPTLPKSILDYILS